MNPSFPRRPAEDAAVRREAARHVKTAENLLSGPNPEFKIERSRKLLIKALHLDPCVPGGHALLVAAIALRTFYHPFSLKSVAPDPYAVLGLDPAVPTARDPAVIEKYYRQASDLLKQARTDPLHPCNPAFSQAARLVADAWAVLSDPDRKASLDSRFETPPQPSAPQKSSPPPPQPSAPLTARRRKSSAPDTSPPAAMTTTPSDVKSG